MKLVFIRHLPTEWNLELRLQGVKDIPIVVPDVNALQEIDRSRRIVDGEGPFDAVYCSQLQRTRQTAEVYGYHDVLSDPLLNELNFGVYEGGLKKEMESNLGEQWTERPETVILGEPVTALAERVKLFLAKNLAHQRVLAFGHGAWGRALASLRTTGDLSQMNKIHIGNSQVMVYEV